MNPIVKNIALKLCVTAPACLLEVLFEILIKAWNNYIREFKLLYRNMDIAELKEISSDDKVKKSSETISSEASTSEFEPVGIEICDKEFPIPQEDEQLFFTYFCKHVKDKNIQPLSVSVSSNQEIPGETNCSVSKDIQTVGNRVGDKRINHDLERKVQNNRKENEVTDIYKVKTDEKNSETENEITQKKEFVIEISLQPQIKVMYKLAEKSKDAMNRYTQNIENNERNLQESLVNENIFDHVTLSTLQQSINSYLSKEAKLRESYILNIQKIRTLPKSSDTVIMHNGMPTDGKKLIASYEEEKNKMQGEYSSSLQWKFNMGGKMQYNSENRLKMGTESLPWLNLSTIDRFVAQHPCYDASSNFLENSENSSYVMYSDISHTLENNNIMNKLECKTDKSLQIEVSSVSTCSTKTSYEERDQKEEGKDKNNQENNDLCGKSEIHDKDNFEMAKEHVKVETSFTPRLCNNELAAVEHITGTEEQYNGQNAVNMKLNISEKCKYEDGRGSKSEKQTVEDKFNAKSSENQKYSPWKESADMKQIKDLSEPSVKSKINNTKEYSMNEFNEQLVKQRREWKNYHKNDGTEGANRVSITQYDKDRSFNKTYNPSTENSLSNIMLNGEVNSKIVASSRQGNGSSIGGDCKSEDQSETAKEKTEEKVENFIEYKTRLKAKQQYLEICHQNVTTVIFGSCPMCTEIHSTSTSAKTLHESNRCNRKLQMYPKMLCESETYLSKSRCREIRQSMQRNVCMKTPKNNRRVSFSENNCIFSFNPEESILETFYDYRSRIKGNMEGKKEEERRCSLTVNQDVGSTPIKIKSASNQIQNAESIEYSLKGDQEQEEIDTDTYTSTVVKDTEIIGSTASSSSNQVLGGHSAEYINLGFEDVPLFDSFPDFQKDSCDNHNDVQNTDDDCLLSKKNVFHKGELYTLPKRLKNAEANVKRWAMKNLMPQKRLSFQKMKSVIQKK